MTTMREVAVSVNLPTDAVLRYVDALSKEWGEEKVILSPGRGDVDSAVLSYAAVQEIPRMIQAEKGVLRP